ncbi:hypothetical protein [Gilliamella apis]|nr:hypothetical protein [Gilliamella apis]WLS95134.1 hypothetical protein RAM17_05840 [Gilliamella apis]
MANRDVWQDCCLQEQITVGALTANEGGRQSLSDHLRGRHGSW